MFDNQGDDQSVIYFTVLVVIEIAVFIFTMISKQNDLTMFNILRIFLLIGAKCMESASWIVQYIIFAFICALISFDPVGLWITGRNFKSKNRWTSSKWYPKCFMCCSIHTSLHCGLYELSF